MLRTVKRHWRTYKGFFKTFIMMKLVYKTDFVLGSINQIISMASSIALIGLLYTQVESINGWGFYELVFLYGVARTIHSVHGFFFFAPFSLGERFIVNGRLDRFKVRPLNVLFQVYASYIQTHAAADIIGGIVIMVYAAANLPANIITLTNLLYFIPALISGIMVFASVFLVFATTGFWTGRTMAIFSVFFHLTEFKNYPFSIYPSILQGFFVTLFPIMFASFFPATFLLGRTQWLEWQIASLLVGPIFYLIAYQFWKYGLRKYSSTGS